MDPSVETQSPPPEGRQLTPELRELLNPAQTAVIVVDVQGAYCDPGEVLPTLLNSDTDELQEIARKLNGFVNRARDSGATIVWTKMAEHPDHVPENIRLKMKIDDTPPIATPDTPGFDYYGVLPEEGDIEIVKTHYNAFDGTDLDEQLREKGIRTVVLTGGYASRCVQATAFGAADSRGYHLFVPKDLVGVPRAYAAEKEAMLSVVDSVIGYVFPSEEISSAWGDQYSSDVNSSTI